MEAVGSGRGPGNETRWLLREAIDCSPAAPAWQRRVPEVSTRSSGRGLEDHRLSATSGRRLHVPTWAYMRRAASELRDRQDSAHQNHPEDPRSAP